MADINNLYSRVTPESLARQAGRSVYADAAGKAANTEVYRRVADSALVNLVGVNYASNVQDGDAAASSKPRLAAPSATAGVEKAKETAEDKFTLLMASLIALLGEVSMDSLKSRLEMLKSMAKAREEGHSALSKQYLSAVMELEAAVAKAGVSEEKLSAALTGLRNAQAGLADADAILDQAEPDTPEYEQALAARNQMREKVTGAEQLVSKSREEHTTAIKVAEAAAKKAEGLGKQIESAEHSSQPVLDGMKNQLNAAATMVLLMTRFAELMGDSAENKVEAEQELFRSMQAARQEFLEKKSEEYQEQVRKAEAAAKVMGCIGKVLGAVLTVASVVGAAFTGGASLALAAVGIALMGADMLTKQLTGVSFMEQAMKPLMESVLNPMIQAIGKGISDILRKLGVDENTANMAGMILGAIIGAVAMVAVLAVVALVGKSAASRLASTMGDMLGKLTSKMAPDMLKQAARAVSNGFTNVLTKARSAINLKSDANSLAMYSTRLQQGVVAAEAGGTAAQSGFQVKAGIHQRNAAEHLSEANFAMVISEEMKNWLSKLVEFFDHSMKEKDAVIRKAFNIQDNTYSTALSMARNI